MCDMKELFWKLKEIRAVTPTELGVDTDKLRRLVAETRANNNNRREVQWKQLRATEFVSSGVG
jgi:hypothetical protein